MTNFSDTIIGQLSLGDVILISSYLILCLLLGIGKSGNIKNIKEYALGQGGITTGALVMTLYATWLGAGTVLGSIEWISTMGLLFVIIVLLKPFIKWPLAIWIFGRNIEQFQECVTSDDIMTRLYGKWGRRITVLAYSLEAITVVSIQMAAIGFLLHYFSGIPIAIGILIGLGVVTAYSGIGGVRAVILTDILQFGIFYIMIPVICGILLYKSGGWNEMAALIPSENWEINLSKENHLSIFLGALFWAAIPADAGGPFIQRFIISMDAKQLVRSLKIVTIIDFTVALMLCLLGFAVATQIKGSISGPETIWQILNAHLPSLAKGLVVVGMSAIIMSTADSYLNNISVLITRDALKRCYPTLSNKSELRLAKLATLLIAMLAGLLAIKEKGIMPLIWISLSFCYPLIVIPITSGFLGFRTNPRSFIAGSILAISGTLIGAYLQGRFDILSTFLGITGSAIGLFGMHYFQKLQGTLTNVAEEEKSWLEGRKARGLPLILPYNSKNEPGIFKEILNPTLYLIGQFKQALQDNNLVQLSNKGALIVAPRYYQFAILGFIYSLYPLLANPALLSNLFLEQNLLWKGETILRLIATFGCLGLAIYNFMAGKEDTLEEESSSQNIMHLYWHGLILLCLPLISTYSYLINPDYYNIIGGMVGIIALAVFVDWVWFIISAFLGLMLGNLLFIALSLLNGYEINYSHALVGSLIYILLTGIMSFLMRYQREQELQNKEIEGRALAGSIAHEVRNPLSTSYEMATEVRNKLLSLIEGSEGDSVTVNKRILLKECEALDFAIAATDRCNNVINTMLKSINGETLNVADFKPVLISKAVQLAINEYAFDYGEKSKVILNIKEDFIFKGEENFMIYILFNLLKNSLYYLKSDPKARIIISTKQEVAKENKFYNCLYFKDTGPGIPKNKLPLLFSNFATSNKKGGTGLGLAFCKRTMKGFGGMITCVSKARSEIAANQESYTEFRLFFPIFTEKKTENLKATREEISKQGKTNALKPPILEEAKISPSKAEFYQNKTILLAEDNNLARMSMKRRLDNLGIKVLEAINGREAIEILEKDKVDLVLMDLEMPELTGDEASLIIRQGLKNSINDPAKLPIIALTADTTQESINKALLAKMDAHYKKGASQEELIALLNSWLR